METWKKDETAISQCKLFELEIFSLKDEIFQLRKDKARLQEKNKKLRFELETDDLTNLRRTSDFAKLCHCQIKKVARRKASPYHNELRLEKKSVAVYVDLDGFGDINKVFGHDTGDLILKAFANSMDRARSDDLAVRKGSGADEFLFLFVGAEEDDVHKRMGRKKAKFEAYVRKNFSLIQPPHFVSFSYGVVTLLPIYNLAQVREAINNADFLMAEHKERRKKERRKNREEEKKLK